MARNAAHYVFRALFAATLLAAGAAWAHDGGGRPPKARVGVFIGTPMPFWSWPYWPPYGYGYGYAWPPTVIAVPAPPPPVYIEQAPQPAAPAPNYWHYCRHPEGYYPYVKECPGGWLKVAPQP